jgi:tetratricopeptide (TPR) repeat protein
MPRFLLACAWLVLASWACVTHARAEVWASNLTLWTDAAAKAPLRPRAFINIGLEKELVGDLNGASQAYLAALALSQQDRLSTYQRVFHRAAAEVNNARVLALSGHPGMALSLLDEVIARHPDFLHAKYNKAVILAWLNACPDARVYADQAGPDFPRLTCAD